MYYSATLQLEEDVFTNFKALVKYVNRDDSPFDFRIRLHNANDASITFDVLFFPGMKTIMYYPSGPDPTKKFSTVDMSMPWLVMRFNVGIAPQKGKRYSIHAYGDGYYAREPVSNFSADLIPTFLGNHHHTEWCMGHDMIAGFHYGNDGQNSLQTTVTEAVFSYIMHYVNSTFNDSLADYKRSFTIYHTLLMAGENLKLLKQDLRNCGRRGCDGALACPIPQVTSMLPAASENQIHTAYEYMAANDMWWSQVPRFIRGTSQWPSGGGAQVRSFVTMSFFGFLKYYQPKDAKHYQAYINEGYGQHRLEEFAEFHSVANEMSYTKQNAQGIWNDTETLVIVENADCLEDLIAAGKKPLDEPTKHLINELSYYSNGTLVYD